MPIASFNVIPADQNGWAQFSFAHIVSHRDINRFINQKIGKTLAEYVLDPMPLFPEPSMDLWDTLHYQMHLNQNAALGIQGANLGDIDWKDSSSVGWFVQQNYIDHYRASKILGIE
jgi:hypothetical protein